MTDEGVVFCCEPNLDGKRQAVCLFCERPFVLQAALLTMRANGEVLGYFCLFCLQDEARAQFEAACVRFSSGAQ